MCSNNLHLAEAGKTDIEASLIDFQSIIVKAGIDSCWALIQNIEKWAVWNDSISDIKTAFRENKSFTFSYNQGKKTYHAFSGKIEAPNIFSYAIHTRLMKGNIVWRFESADENETIITLEKSYESFFIPVMYSHHRLHQDILYWLAQCKKTLEKN